MVNSDIIKLIKNYILLIPDEYGVTRVFLFGSYAKGKEREGSDIDLAIILKNMPDFFEAQRIFMRLRREVDLRIEPHPINEIDFNNLNPFAYEIQKTGIEIKLLKNMKRSNSAVLQ